jgi:hypothetical protein
MLSGCRGSFKFICQQIETMAVFQQQDSGEKLGIKQPEQSVFRAGRGRYLASLAGLLSNLELSTGGQWISALDSGF